MANVEHYMKRTILALFIILSLVVGVNNTKANPNASITHIYFHQGDGTIIDLINGGIANVYVDQPASVNLTAFNPDLGEQGAYLYFTLDSTKSTDHWVQRGSSYWQQFVWDTGISSIEGTYTYHAKLWWDNGGTPVLQDSKDITIAVTQRPLGYDLSIKLIDQAGRPIAGAMVTVEGLGTVETASDGSVPFALAPAGTYSISAMWQSQYNPEEVTIAKSTITLDKTTTIILQASVYDVEFQLVTPSEQPIAGAEMSLAGVVLGITGSDGKVIAPQVPSKHTEASAAYPVTAMWLGVDVSPGPVMITASRMYMLTATNVATLTVQAVGAQGQALNAPQVEIENSAGTTVFSGFGNDRGVVSVVVPYGTYSVSVNYKGFMNTASTSVNSPSGTVQTIATNVFIEIFGQAMTFATFLLWLVILALIILAPLIIVVRLRKKKVLPPPPPPP